MTQKQDKNRERASEKDKILKLIEELKYVYLDRIISELEIEKYKLNDYIAEMKAADYLIRNLDGNVPVVKIQVWLTDRGRTFLKEGGYTEVWRDEVEAILKEEEMEAIREADRKVLELDKINLERKKVNISKWALGISFVGLAFSGYTSFKSGNNSSEIRDRIQAIEYQLPELRNSTRVDSQEQLVGELKFEVEKQFQKD